MKTNTSKKTSAVLTAILVITLVTSLGFHAFAKSGSSGNDKTKGNNRGSGRSSVVRGERMEGEKHDHRSVRSKTRIRAEIFDDVSAVKIKQDFFTTAATSTPAIAELIADKMKLTRDDIARLLMVKNKEGEPKEVKEKLRVRAEARNGTMRVKSEFRFGLASTTKESIIDGIFAKLSALTANDILANLTLRIRHHHGQSH